MSSISGLSNGQIANNFLELQDAQGNNNSSDISQLTALKAQNTASKNAHKNSTSTPQDQITLSVQAQASLKQTTSKNGTETNISASLSVSASISITDPDAAYYAQFFPTRNGNSMALGEGCANPGLQTISAGKSPSEIAQAARKSMDAEYKAMSDSGQAYSESAYGDTNTLFSGLDRTALAAVANNQDGLFTQNEQNDAQFTMGMQQDLAMGLYEGPKNLESKFVTALEPFDDKKLMTAKDVSFLDRASAYEKSTIQWAMNRSDVEICYQLAHDGQESDAVSNKKDLSYTVVDLLTDAMKSMKEITDHAKHNDPSAKTRKELFQESWMQGYEDRFDKAWNITRKALGFPPAKS